MKKSEEKELGIYIHIPFCMKKCYYCDFVSYANEQKLIEQYIEALKKEIKSVGVGVTSTKISTIYIGGGTPSFIDSKYIVQILNIIEQNFDLLYNAEITIEVNPGTITKEKLEDYIKCGINRISIGLQSTNDILLKEIGRIHTYEQFLETYKLVKAVGFKNINIDLMLGLPNQTMEILEDSVEKIVKLNPQHISIYSLILEEGTKLYDLVEANTLTILDDEIERDMYWKIKEKLDKAGYIHYEISNFAKQGYESIHNMNCWDQKEYIGFGVAAHSYMDNKRYSNTEKIKDYIVGVGLVPTQISIIHEVQDILSKQKEFMMLGLRKIEGVKISDFKNKFTQNPLYIFRNELNKLVEQELLEIDMNNIKLTNKGLDLANIVWEEFV